MTGDGFANLITPNPDPVAVLVAEEGGAFRLRTTLPAAFGPFPIVAADLNRGGRQHLAVARPERQAITVPQQMDDARARRHSGRSPLPFALIQILVGRSVPVPRCYPRTSDATSNPPEQWLQFTCTLTRRRGTLILPPQW